MIEHGFRPDFSPRITAELDHIKGPSESTEGTIRDLTHLLWCSIDNDESRDLDQLTVAEALASGAAKVYVAIADVDALVDPSSAIDDHARFNTTSVYTPAAIFTMLPEKLSTDLTSLGFEVNRLAIVVEMEIGEDGSQVRSDVYRASVRNRAKLAYNSVAAWLDKKAQPPTAISNVAGLDENLQLQDRVARKLKSRRHTQGALSLETVQARPVFDDSHLMDLSFDAQNRARDIIEDFMIAANSAVVHFLASHGSPSIRRVVRTPKDWSHIVTLAAERGARLPAQPDSAALEHFLSNAQAADPIRFPDLSLSVIKLLGAGEYVLERVGGATTGHFSLAVRDYAHSTAPNRRFPDVITQRLLKATLAKRPAPYGDTELAALAKHCTEAEDAAKKVERQVAKCGGALLLRSRIGERFDALVTGASEKGTWVRLLHPPIEGRLMTGFEGAKVGARFRVQLTHVDLENAHIDFQRA